MTIIYMHRLVLLVFIQYYTVDSSPLANEPEKTHSLWKRSLVSDEAGIFHRSVPEISGSIQTTLFNNLIQESRALDVVLLLDGSLYMGEENFNIGRHFLARLVGAIPKSKFLDGSIRTSMITYSIIGSAVRMFDFSWEYGQYREMVRRAIKQSVYQGGIENHGVQGLLWSFDLLGNSSRSRAPDTTKIIMYATNGRITDADAIWGPHINSWNYIANALRTEGVKVLMIPIGTRVNRENIRVMATRHNKDYIIPVANMEAADNIINHLKRLQSDTS